MLIEPVVFFSPVVQVEKQPAAVGFDECAEWVLQVTLFPGHHLGAEHDAVTLARCWEGWVTFLHDSGDYSMSLAFITHTYWTYTGVCAFGFVPLGLCCWAAEYFTTNPTARNALIKTLCCTVLGQWGLEEGKTERGQLGLLLSLLEVHLNDMIMIDCWYDFMTHYWAWSSFITVVHHFTGLPTGRINWAICALFLHTWITSWV